MQTKTPSLHRRFLRIFIGIAAATTLLISAGIATADYTATRRTQLHIMEHAARTVSHMFLLLKSENRLAELPSYLEAFRETPSLLLLCVYDADNRLLSSWQRQEGICPALMTKSGMESGASFARIALPVANAGEYAGMVYAEGELYSLRYWAGLSIVILLALLATASLACILAAKLTTRSIEKPLRALSRQLENIRNNDIASPVNPREYLTQETLQLSQNIGALRQHFDQHFLSRELVANMRHWHWEILSGFISALRQQLSAESPLLDKLGDYALLLQGECGDILPPPQHFDIARALDNALTQARIGHSSDKVNITASLAPGMPREWSGQPEIIEALIKHLLLIGLKRTENGFVCLRIEADRRNTGLSSSLRITLDDSGPFIQHGQLQQWLLATRDDAPPTGVTMDISWLLVVRLIRRLGGEISGAGGKQGGLSLEARLPLIASGEDAKTPVSASSQSIIHELPPLVMVVDLDKDSQAAADPVLKQTGALFFTVGSLMQALEWAPVLPLSVIILNTGEVEDTQDITRRLRHLMQAGVMPVIPLWIITAQHSFSDFASWRRQGISELLLKPLRSSTLAQAFNTLPKRDKEFYFDHDEHTQNDMFSNIHSFPKMTGLLAEQLREVEPVLETLIARHPAKNGRDRAHAVRSAALTLGYFRLAALMGQIEHAASAPRHSLSPANWQIVLDMIRNSGFDANASAELRFQPSGQPPRRDNAPGRMHR